MTIRLYLDEDSINHALARALRARGVDVISALDADLIAADDETQLTYATAQGRVLVSCNIGDFLRLHDSFIAAKKDHAGIILIAQQQYGLGEQLRRILALIAALSVEAMHNRVEFLSSWGKRL